MKPTDGLWNILTASGSRYLLDLGQMTVQRIPGEEANPLRRDSETMKVVEVITLEPEVMMELVIDLREDGVLTYRRTTAVETMERVVRA